MSKSEKGKNQVKIYKYKVKSIVRRIIHGRLPQPFGLRNDIVFLVDFAGFAGENHPNLISKRRYLMGHEKMKNKANFNLGKIDVSSLKIR